MIIPVGMRIFTALIFTLSYIGTSLSYGGQQCSILFGAHQEPVVIAGLLPAPKPKPIVEISSEKSDSPRVELKKYVGSEGPEKITIKEMKFSEKPEEASIELMRMLIQNSSYVLEEKNVLTKGELSIGIPVKNGYYFEVTYKSMSSERSQFVVDKISLRTPTGSGSKKVAEGFLKAGEIKIKKAEHEIGDILGEGINPTLKIPLVIDGPLLKKIDTLSKFFEFFRKDELRKLLQSNSMLKIRTVFEFRRALSVFTKVLFKEPMKAAIGMGFVIMVASNPINVFNKTATPDPIATSVMMATPRETGYLQTVVNGYTIPQQATALRAEIVELNKQIATYTTSNEPYTGPSLAEIRTDHSGAFSDKHQTMIVQKKDKFNNSLHTYIIFSEEKASTQGPGLQYLVMEINAAKYPELIKVIQTQTSIPAAQSVK